MSRNVSSRSRSEGLGRPLPDAKEFEDTTYEVTKEWGE